MPRHKGVPNKKTLQKQLEQKEKIKQEILAEMKTSQDTVLENNKPEPELHHISFSNNDTNNELESIVEAHPDPVSSFSINDTHLETNQVSLNEPLDCDETVDDTDYSEYRASLILKIKTYYTNFPDILGKITDRQLQRIEDLEGKLQHVRTTVCNHNVNTLSTKMFYTGIQVGEMVVSTATFNKINLHSPVSLSASLSQNPEIDSLLKECLIEMNTFEYVEPWKRLAFTCGVTALSVAQTNNSLKNTNTTNNNDTHNTNNNTKETSIPQNLVEKYADL